jgi:hypothetical protein
MKLFTKNISNQRLFNKQGQQPTFFNKIGTLARQGDNTIARVGNFLSSSARSIGLHPFAGAIDAGVKTVHDIRNNLEKSIKNPVSELRHYN